MDKFCDFKTLDNVKMDKIKGERGLYCSRLEYNYNLESTNQLTTVLEKRFEVVGAENEAVTYLFDLTLGFDFVTTGQLKALVRRVDHGDSSEYSYDPLKCLYDHSCFEAELIAKNQLSINVILTTGKYELIVFDMMHNQVR